MSNPDFTYPRETVEYVFFDELAIHGVTPTQAEYNLTIGLERPDPTTWVPLDIIDGRFAFLLSGTLEPTDYKVWVRVPEAPENSVTEVAKIRIT